MYADECSAALAGESEMLRKVAHSTIAFISLTEGRVMAEQIERAFSSKGCGAVLIKLDRRHSALYERFYRLQWQLGTRAFDTDVEEKAAAIEFAALDLPVQHLLCRCGLGVARARKGRADAMPESLLDVEKFLRTDPTSLTNAIGRPLALNRKEFHPSVEWLLQQEQAGSLRQNNNSSYEVVAYTADRPGSEIIGPSQADEARLLALYQEWKSATPEEQRGDGNKHNGDVYYGAFRGRIHMDAGSTMTVLLGPGEVRDCRGFPVAVGTKSRELGGTLMVAPPSEKTFTSLPYRLPCGSPYVVVFFEDHKGGQSATRVGEGIAINANALGWTGTRHGVRRIEDTGFSRGQAVVHLRLTEADLA